MLKVKYSRFDWQIPKIVATLPKGEDAEKLHKAYETEVQKFPIKDWSRLKYDSYKKEIYNSNNIDAGVVNNLVKNSGIRVAVPGDDIYGDIFRLIQGKYYTDFNANCVHKNKPSYEKNNGLWRKVIELAEKTNGDVKYPFMIQGFYNVSDKSEENYGVKIVPASNFKIIEDDRLSEKYNGWKFDNVDENGLPLNLDKLKGGRTWHTGNEGLLGFNLDRYSGLGSWDGDLAGSVDDGRVVFVDDAGGVALENFNVEKMIKEKRLKLDSIEKEYLQKIKYI